MTQQEISAILAPTIPDRTDLARVMAFDNREDIARIVVELSAAIEPFRSELKVAVSAYDVTIGVYIGRADSWIGGDEGYPIEWFKKIDRLYTYSPGRPATKLAEFLGAAIVRRAMAASIGETPLPSRGEADGKPIAPRA